MQTKYELNSYYIDNKKNWNYNHITEHESDSYFYLRKGVLL